MKAIILLLIVVKSVEGQVNVRYVAGTGRGPSARGLTGQGLMRDFNPLDEFSLLRRFSPWLNFNTGMFERASTTLQPVQPSTSNHAKIRKQRLMALRKASPTPTTRRPSTTKPGTKKHTTISEATTKLIRRKTDTSTKSATTTPTTRRPSTTKTATKKRTTISEATTKLIEKTTAASTKKTTTTLAVTVPAVTLPEDETAELRRVREAVQRLLVLDKVWRARFVHIAFHDCFGGCDGCINFNDTANTGLPEVLEKIDELRTQHGPHLSRADFIAFAGVIASEVAVQARILTREAIRVPYRLGRTDCPDPKNPPFRMIPHGNIINATDVLMKEFRITKRQAVALMGAHSLGEMHKEFSGFGDHPWDISENILDHGYFVELARIGKWKPQKVDNELAKSHQWVAVTENQTVVMLHADMSMLKNYDLVGQFEAPSCSFKNCQNNTKTASVVIEYAHNIRSFLKEFTAGFSKMIEKGLSYP